MEQQDQPYINAHRVGDHKIEIEMLFVPRDQRGKGVGRQFYQQWESNLPPDIHVVQIWSADTGNGNARNFWDSLGFCYKYDNPDDWPVDEDTMDWMVKGVNGHPTPTAILIEPPDDYYDSE